MGQAGMADVQELILVGFVFKPHGLHGEVKVKPATDIPSRFQNLKRAFMMPINGKYFKITIEKAKLTKGIVIIKIKGINSISEAEAVVGNEIVILREDCVKLPPDTYYIFDLIGLQVVLSHGKLIGTVEDVHAFPAQDILFVKTLDGRDIMIPFVKEIVPEVSFSQKKIIVNNIEGLLNEE